MTLKKTFIGLFITCAAVLVLCACSSKPNLEVDIACDNNWTADSTPMIMHCKNDKTDVYHAIQFNKDGNKLQLDKGEYDLEFTSPVNADGTYYLLASPKKISIESDFTIKVEAEHVAFDKIDQKVLANIGTNINTAVDNGDETLKGDTGAKIKSSYAKNVKAYEDKKASELPITGTWGMTAPAGGARGSMTINSDGSASLTEWQSTCPEKYSYNGKIEVLPNEKVPASFGEGSKVFKFVSNDGSSNRYFVYVASKDALSDCSLGSIDDSILTFMNQGYKWVRA